MKSRLRLDAKAFPILGGIALIMQVIDPSRVWMILLIGIGGTWLVCWWWARGLARSFSFEREMRYGWAQVGDKLEERFTLKNRFALPATSVTVWDHSTLPDHRASIATGVDGLSTSEWKIMSRCTRRGIYTLGGTTLETGDPLGIYTAIIEDLTSFTLPVMPPIVSLPGFQILSSGWSGEGKTSSRSLEETMNASHTREMVPNDPMRWIHWKSTARYDKFHVRQFDGTPAGDRWILLDLHKDSQLGSGWDSTEEHGVILAASLAAQGLAEGHSVGSGINCREPLWLVPQRNEYQQRSILKSLAVASPSQIRLDQYIQRIGKLIGNHSSLLIITACVEVEWIQSLIPLMWRGIAPTVFLLDPITFGGQTDASEISSALQMMGVLCHLIPKQLLDTPEARPGQEGEWQWRVSPTGKAILLREPIHFDWRRLND
jgi:uncharacterized protein (DUF58 family)